MNAEDHGTEQATKLSGGRDAQMEMDEGITPPRPTKASNSPDDLTLAIVNSEVARGIKELTSPLSE